MAGSVARGRHPLRVSQSRREEALDRFERAVEMPLLLLAVAMVPLLVIPLVVDLPRGLERTFIAIDWLIWGVFAFEFVVQLALAPAKLRFIRREWPDLLIVLLPFLRPLRLVRSARALRLLRLARLAAFLGEVGKEATRLLVRHRLHYALVATLIAVVIGARLALLVEEGSPDASITTFGDALWWAISTVTTVGYGDVFPTTPAGRGLSVFLMLTGIGVVSVLTANIAAFFLDPEHGAPDPHLTEIVERLQRIESRLNELEAGK